MGALLPEQRLQVTLRLTVTCMRCCIRICILHSLLHRTADCRPLYDANLVYSRTVSTSYIAEEKIVHRGRHPAALLTKM